MLKYTTSPTVMKIHKVEKYILLTVPNPEFKKLLQPYSHLRRVFIEAMISKQNYRSTGASDLAKKIKTNMPARTGKTGEPVTELTKFGWMIMSP